MPIPPIGALMELSALGFGAVLPGDPPGGVMTGALVAPSGAAVVVPDGAIGADMPLSEDAGAVLPGDMLGLAIAGALVAPFGAGLEGVVCAQAMPADTIKAAEASQSERMKSLLECF